MPLPVDKKLVFSSRNEGLGENMLQLNNVLFLLAVVDSCLRK